MDWEFAVLDFIHNNIANPVLDFVAVFISSLGTMSILWVVLTAVLLINKKTRRLGAAMAVAVILVFIIGNLILKPMIARVRPYEINSTINLLVAKENDYSFPSGHTYFAFCCATVIFMRHKKVGTAFLIFAVFMGLSRLYLYVHFPTDVICGAVLGIIVGIAAHFIEKKLYSIKENRKLRAQSHGSDDNS